MKKATQYAIGLAVNGNNAKAALLSLENGKTYVRALECTDLQAPAYGSAHSLKKPVQVNQDLFSINEEILDSYDIDRQRDLDDHPGEPSDTSLANMNIRRIYALLERFEKHNTSVAINSPVLNIKYDYLDKDRLERGNKLTRRFKQKTGVWNHEENNGRRTKYLNLSDSKTLQVCFQSHLPMIDIMAINTWLRVNGMNLVLMDTNELALTDLVKGTYELGVEEITGIVYIEQDFSRVIFLKGSKLHHITPVIHKSSDSEDVLEAIYRKILFAQDQHFVPEINRILLTCGCVELTAKDFFKEQFPNATTDFLNTDKIAFGVNADDSGLLFAQYAITIALAWKALRKKVSDSHSINLLPQEILEGQKRSPLAYHGYILLVMLSLTAFFFTGIVVTKHIDLRKTTKKTNLMKRETPANGSLADSVKSYNEQAISLEKKLAFMDSLSRGSDVFIRFLANFNQIIKSVGEISITELTQNNRTVHIKGIAKARGKIPRLVDALGGAKVTKITRSKLHDEKIFVFHLQKDLN